MWGVKYKRACLVKEAKKMKRSFPFLFALGLLVLWMSPAFSDPGEAGAAFLKIDVDARAAAMGGTGVSTTMDSTALYWNPACLINIKHHSLSTMGNIWFEDVVHGWASWGAKLGRDHAIGIGVNGLQVEGIEMRESDTPDFEEGNAQFYAGTVAFATRITRNLTFGAGATLASGEICGTQAEEFGLGVDLGALYTQRNLSLALSVQDIGIADLTYVEEGDPLPMIVRGGASCVLLRKSLILSGELDYNVTESTLAARAGAELTLGGGGAVAISLRLGGYHGLNLGDEGLKSRHDAGLGVTCGFGIRLKSLSLDVAFVPMGDLGRHLGDLGLTERVSLGLGF
jgi:hypothetical protein